MGIKDNQLSYKCKKRNKKWLKPVNDLIKKFSSVYQFHTLMKLQYQIKKLFTVN